MPATPTGCSTGQPHRSARVGFFVACQGDDSLWAAQLMLYLLLIQ
jgi:hypothetical protein